MLTCVYDLDKVTLLFLCLLVFYIFIIISLCLFFLIIRLDHFLNKVILEGFLAYEAF